MKRAIVLTHAPFEGPGRVGDLLHDAGFALDVRALYNGDPVPRRAELERSDVLVVMGGPMGVGDRADPAYPYLAREVELLRELIAQDAPVLGICLGAQLLAHAAGAAVYPMVDTVSKQRVYEVGFGPLEFHRGVEVLEGLPEQVTVLHWHGDTFGLPRGALRLASTAVCENQGFQLGKNIFALQFHCECRSQDVAGFLTADGGFVTKANGPHGVEHLRRDIEAQMPEFRRVGDQLLGNIVQAWTRAQ